VVVAGLRIQHVLVGEERVEDLDHAGAVFVVDTEVGVHQDLLSLGCRPPSNRFAFRHAKVLIISEVWRTP